MTTDTLLLGDFNAHHSSWHSSTTDTRGTNLENTINGTNFGILNWDTPTRMPSKNDDINQAKNRHKCDKWRTFVETLDHKSTSSRLWRTIKALDGKSKQTAENEAITFNGSQVSSPKQIANRFNEQFTTSKLGKHNSSREIRLVSREVRINNKETTVTFTNDLVTRAIRSCSNTKALGPDKLSIFHLKHLGPRAIAYLTALFNDSVNSSRIPSI